MSERQDIYILKPQRCFVTLSGKVLNVPRWPETGAAPATAHQGPDTDKTSRKIPELRLFHHPV